MGTSHSFDQFPPDEGFVGITFKAGIPVKADKSFSIPSFISPISGYLAQRRVLISRSLLTYPEIIRDFIKNTPPHRLLIL